MSSASFGQEFGRGQMGESGIGKEEMGGTSIHGLNPSMEIREVRLDEGHKGFSRDVIYKYVNSRRYSEKFRRSSVPLMSFIGARRKTP